MAYKKYIYREGKKFGPYYYESYRDKDGKIRKKYLGTEDPNDKKKITKKSVKKKLPRKKRKLITPTSKKLFFVFFAFSFAAKFNKIATPEALSSAPLWISLIESLYKEPSPPKPK